MDATLVKLASLLPDLIGFLLTLVVLLYLFFGDNALFRLVTYIFIGVVSGYISVLVIFNVLVPRLAALVLSNNLPFVVIGAILILLGLLMLFKLSPRLSRFGSVPMAILVGVGAAVAIGGAIFGTLFGQVGGTIASFNFSKGGNLLAGLYVLIGTITSLAYFQFSTRSRAVVPGTEEATTNRALSMEVLAKIGQIFIGIILGAMFAGVYTAAITAMVERLGFLFNTVINILRIANIL